MAKVKITLVKSTIGSSETQRRTARALGLRKVGSSVVQEDSPTVRGNIRKIEHLLSVEETDA